MDLEGKVAFVTGGSGDVGGAIGASLGRGRGGILAHLLYRQFRRCHQVTMAANDLANVSGIGGTID